MEGEEISGESYLEPASPGLTQVENPRLSSLTWTLDQAGSSGIQVRRQTWGECLLGPEALLSPHPGPGRGCPLTVGPQLWEPGRAVAAPDSPHPVCLSVPQAVGTPPSAQWESLKWVP